MISLLGKTQIFKVGDKVEIFNTITKKVSRIVTIIGEGTVMNEKGEKWGNTLQSARLLK
jgi:hypothetical protein